MWWKAGWQAGSSRGLGRTYKVLHPGDAGPGLREELLENVQGLGCVISRKPPIDDIIPAEAVCENPRVSNLSVTSVRLPGSREGR